MEQVFNSFVYWCVCNDLHLNVIKCRVDGVLPAVYSLERSILELVSSFRDLRSRSSNGFTVLFLLLT